jgi:hypothetical protein
MSLALALLAATSPLAGIYDGGQMEMATRLRLVGDGTFQFALSYGALDEVAKGRWTERDGKVLLTTEPAPKPPAFTVVKDEPAPAGQLYVVLADPDLLQGAPVTVAVTYADSDQPSFVEAGDDGRVPVDEARKVVAIVPDLPVYPLPLAPYRLGPGGHRVTFTFEMNDFGIAGFAAEPLQVEDGDLLMRRHDRLIRFRRVGE